MSVKKIILWTGLLGVLLLFVGFVLNSNLCFHDSYCKNISNFFESIFDNIFVISIMVVFLFSLPHYIFFLLTYRLHESVFRAWWKPARWWIPIIIIATLITSVIDSQSGSHVGDFPISIPVLGLLYLIFILTSIIKITRAYRKTKPKHHK